jgi:hypothetical protein
LPAFPGGPSGYGLLLLRVALAVAAGIIGSARLMAVAATWGGATVDLVGITGAVWIVAGVAIGFGGLTRYAGIVIALAEVGVLLLWLSGASTAAPHPFEAVVALGLGLVGPGAYSIDARLFGRREIVIRPHSLPPSE